jgi:hypothetical protein
MMPHQMSIPHQTSMIPQISNMIPSQMAMQQMTMPNMSLYGNNQNQDDGRIQNQQNDMAMYEKWLNSNAHQMYGGNNNNLEEIDTEIFFFRQM